MELHERFERIKSLLPELLELISAEDQKAIQGERLEHPWIEQVMNFSPEEHLQFEAHRKHEVLNDEKWKKTIEEIKDLAHFNQYLDFPQLQGIIGNQKKRHELSGLKYVLADNPPQKVCDFGGGVGKLATFLNQEFQSSVHVFEKDPALIRTGKQKLAALKDQIQFVPVNIGPELTEISELTNCDLAIGLHTCGRFANDMLRNCIHNNTKQIVNFACCYSKITEHDYHLSQNSNKELIFNQRALAAATLGYSPTSADIYHYRIKIMTFKNSLHHWLYKYLDHKSFLPMSNARRTLYDKSFYDFLCVNLERFFPGSKIPDQQEVLAFYDSFENKELNQYFQAYYAIARYIGELLELYLLCDRALYLEEQGYQVNILAVFDPQISPRNKAIIAERR